MTKDEFMGTRAWYFFCLNVFKVPFFVHAGMITTSSLLTGLTIIPAVLAGAVVGVLILKRIHQKQFAIIAKIIALAGSIKLLLP